MIRKCLIGFTFALFVSAGSIAQTKGGLLAPPGGFNPLDKPNASVKRINQLLPKIRESGMPLEAIETALDDAIDSQFLSKTKDDSYALGAQECKIKNPDCNSKLAKVVTELTNWGKENQVDINKL